MTCPRCQGVMRVKSIATEAGEIQAILGAVPSKGLSETPPGISSNASSAEISPMREARGVSGWKGEQGESDGNRGR